MNSTDFAQLKGKVARNVYAIIKFELMEQGAVLSKAQEKDMAEYMYEAIKNSDKSIRKAMKSAGMKPTEREPRKRGR
jgi:hypothetical protein